MKAPFPINNPIILPPTTSVRKCSSETTLSTQTMNDQKARNITASKFTPEKAAKTVINVTLVAWPDGKE